MNNSTINNLTINGAFALQLKKNISASINTEIEGFLKNEGGMLLGNRYYAFSDFTDFGRKLIWIIANDYIEQFKNLEKIGFYMKFNSNWATTEHHTEDINIYNEAGEVIDVQTTSITNKDYYKAIETNDEFYVKLTDSNISELIPLMTWTNSHDGIGNLPNEVVKSLPIVEQEEIIE